MVYDRSAEVAALYQEMILDHYRRPRNKGDLPGADESVLLRNPLCGDEITLHVAFDADRLRDLRFTGRGCSISQASASMMTQAVKGLSAGEVSALRERFREMVMGNTSGEDLGSLRALGGVSRFPARVRCALLAWEALEQIVAKHEGELPIRS